MTQMLRTKAHAKAPGRPAESELCRRYGIATVLICQGILAFAVGAHAADPVPACCADLEDRIAELLATAPASKHLEIEISGQLHRSLLNWSDGSERNSYIVDPTSGGSYFTFSGDAELSGKWEAGFLLGIETTINKSDELSQSVTSTATATTLGAAKFYLAHEDIGSIGLGRQTEAHDHITEIDFSATDDFASPAVMDWNGGFLLRQSGGRLDPSDPLAWAFFAADDIGDGEEAPVVRFDTPEDRKLQASLSWGAGGVSAVALRYADNWGDFEIMGGTAFAYYADDTRSPCRDADDLAGCGTLAGSLSLKHKPSAISLTGAFGVAAIDPSQASGSSYWYYAKLARAWSLTTLGPTTTYAEHFHGARNTRIDLDEIFDGATGTGEVNATTSVVGFGLMQTLDTLEIDFYIAFRHYDIDVDVIAGRPTSLALEPFNAILTGSRITF